MSDSIAESPFVSVPEAARILGRSDDTVRRLVRDGVLSVQRLPRAHPQLLRAEVQQLARASIVPGSLSSQLAGSTTSPNGTDSTTEIPSMKLIGVHDPILVTDLDGRQHRVLATALKNPESPTTDIKFASVGANLSARSASMRSRWISHAPVPTAGCWTPIPGR